MRAGLTTAGLVIASDLTLVECDRVLLRATAAGEIAEAEAAARRAALNRAAAHWILFRVDTEVVERARRPFPIEPTRTLDAVHLSTALLTRTLVPDLSLLSLDRRLRDNAQALGFEVAPSGETG